MRSPRLRPGTHASSLPDERKMYGHRHHGEKRLPRLYEPPRAPTTSLPMRNNTRRTIAKRMNSILSFTTYLRIRQILHLSRRRCLVLNSKRFSMGAPPSPSDDHRVHDRRRALLSLDARRQQLVHRPRGHSTVSAIRVAIRFRRPASKPAPRMSGWCEHDESHPPVASTIRAASARC